MIIVVDVVLSHYLIFLSLESNFPNNFKKENTFGGKSSWQVKICLGLIPVHRSAVDLTHIPCIDLVPYTQIYTPSDCTTLYILLSQRDFAYYERPQLADLRHCCFRWVAYCNIRLTPNNGHLPARFEVCHIAHSHDGSKWMAKKLTVLIKAWLE